MDPDDAVDQVLHQHRNQLEYALDRLEAADGDRRTPRDLITQYYDDRPDLDPSMNRLTADEERLTHDLTYIADHSVAIDYDRALLIGTYRFWYDA